MGVRKALFWKKGESEVICELCVFKCHLKPGDSGKCLCRVRINDDLITTSYGRVSRIEVRLSHELPLANEEKAKWLSVGGFGCNLRCPGCSDHVLAFANPLTPSIPPRDLSPEELVGEAVFSNCSGIFFSYNEPLMLAEYVLDVFKEAKKKNLRTGIFTNGTATPKAMESFIELTDNFVFDLKGFSRNTYRNLTGEWIDLNWIGKNIKLCMEKGKNVELATTVVPRMNDSVFEMRSLARWIKFELEADMVWHLLPFRPSAELYYLNPTSSEKLIRIAEIAAEEGLKRVILH